MMLTTQRVCFNFPALAVLSLFKQHGSHVLSASMLAPFFANPALFCCGGKGGNDQQEHPQSLSLEKGLDHHHHHHHQQQQQQQEEEEEEEEEEEHLRPPRDRRWMISGSSVSTIQMCQDCQYCGEQKDQKIKALQKLRSHVNEKKPPQRHSTLLPTTQTERSTSTASVDASSETLAESQPLPRRSSIPAT